VPPSVTWFAVRPGISRPEFVVLNHGMGTMDRTSRVEVRYLFPQLWITNLFSSTDRIADPTRNLSQHIRVIRVWRARTWVAPGRRGRKGARGAREEEVRRLGFGRR
jgi:hypothetical protein